MFKKNTLLVSLSITLLGAGFIFLLLWQNIIDIIISNQFVLGPNKPLFTLWQESPLLNLDLYMWNWTNPEEIHNISSTLRFQQLGPYRYKEIKEKVNIHWHDNNKTVSFQHKKRFFFDPEGSVGSLDDNITTINPVAASVVHQTKSWGFVAKTGLSMVLNSAIEDVFITKTVNEILFEGYDDFFLNLAQNLPFLVETSMPPFKKFGWFYNRNGSSSYEGRFNMETGNGNTIGKLKSWNNWKETPFFSDSCGHVKGSAGELFKAKQERDKIEFFSTDLCRTVKLDYEEDISVHGINAYKFSGQDSMLDNGEILPENSCFCNGECVPYGIMNISSCRYGSPAFVSLPHFFRADPIVLENIEGMEPNKDKHEFFIALEPETGIPVQVSARLQLNLLVQPIPLISLYRDLPKLFFPVLWFEQSITLPESLSFFLKLFLHLPYIFLCLGIISIALSIVCAIILVKKPVKILIRGKSLQCGKVLSKEEVPLRMTA